MLIYLLFFFFPPSSSWCPFFNTLRADSPTPGTAASASELVPFFSPHLQGDLSICREILAVLHPADICCQVIP